MRFLLVALVGVMFCGCAPTHTAYVPTMGHTKSDFIIWANR